LLFLGNQTEPGRVDDTSAAIVAAIEQIGPRLRHLRALRRMTLTSLAQTNPPRSSASSRGQENA
jgi:hypothetical protein